MFRPIADILNDLKKPIDPGIISEKPIFKKGQKVGNVSFVAWYDLVTQLDYICPGWHFELRTQFLPDRCVIEGRLTIKAAEGEFIREATGVEPLDSNGYGDPVYSAESSALRRAMAKFGYGLDLWRKEECQVKNVNFSTPTPVKNSQDLSNRKITDKQNKLIHAIARNESGLNHDQIKRIIKNYANYESTKDIIMGHLDPIIALIKEARFLDDDERRELINWWRGEGIDDLQAKSALDGMGYDSTANILRKDLNGVKTAILQATGRIGELKNG